MGKPEMTKNMSMSGRALVCAAVGAGVVTALLRLAAFNGFENDHFMHVAWAQQLALGALPGRDFVEPGMPLAIVLSAIAQFVWPGYLSEAVLGAASLGLAGAMVCVATAGVTRSIGLGLAASTFALALYPRFYSYPKVLVPAVALWLVGRYVVSRSTRGLWLLALWSVVAFLLRHDLGLMAAVAIGVAILVDAAVPPRARLVAALRFAVMGLVLVTPYLVYLQAVEGIGEHVRVGTEFGKGEQHQLLLTGPSLFPGPDERVVAVGAWAFSAEAVLFWLFSAVTVALAWWVVRAHRRPEAPVVAALVVLAIAYRLVILRYPLRARLPDAATVAAVAGGIVASLFAATLGRTRHARPALALAIAVLGLCAGTAVVASTWSVVNMSDRWSQAGLDRGPRGVAINLRDLVRDAVRGSWQPYWPAGDEPPVIDYLTRCTRRTDRLLVTWFAPEYYVYAQRGFAAGHALFLPSSFATELDEALMLARLGRESVPVVLINETAHEEFARAFPAVAAYLASRYTVHARFNHNDDTVIGVAFRHDVTPPRTTDAAPWPCEPSSAAVLEKS